MYTYDTETCGFHGMPVLIQYSIGMGEIFLHEIWYEPIWKTLRLIEDMMEQGVIGFHLSFDHFQLCKAYTVLRLCKDHNALPIDCIYEIAALEPEGRDGPCLKPRHALDLMMYARKGPYQSTMDRKPVRIRKVPAIIAPELVKELESRVELRDIYFSKRKDKRAAKWAMYECKDRETGAIDPNFYDVVLKFRPSSSLKAISEDVFNVAATRFKEIQIPAKFNPEEVGYAPFALALEPDGLKHGFKKTWPAMIKEHAAHWRYRPDARGYAEKDIEYTRGLYYHWGEPQVDDDDSVLTCMVAACRWKGYTIDIPAIKKLRADKLQLTKDTPKSPRRVKDWIWPDLDEAAKLVTKGSTAKVALEALATFKDDNDPTKPHPAAVKALRVLDARKATKEIELYDKLILAGRFHASFIVIGALSSRMAGSGGDLNSQGIKRTKEVRRCFPLADGIDFQLCGGDFESFEVTIADAVWGDEKLHRDLLQGKSIHGIFGTFVYPGMTYEEIMATKGTANDIYNKCKSAMFAMMYGGEGFTLKSRLGVDIETADAAHLQFITEYSAIRRQLDYLTARYCTITQPGGLGTKIYWKDPEDFIETIFGDRRYFTLENTIAKIIFELSEKPPPAWLQYKGTVNRNKTLSQAGKDQKIAGAVRSALYATAFALQAANKRAAGNHGIQSAGARITKRVETAIWELQPFGIHDWIVQPMNIHDEIMCPVRLDYVDRVKEIVDAEVESFREKIPLIGLTWDTRMKSWADK